jgi:hypothetical protein
MRWLCVLVIFVALLLICGCVTEDSRRGSGHDGRYGSANVSPLEPLPAAVTPASLAAHPGAVAPHEDLDVVDPAALPGNLPGDPLDPVTVALGRGEREERDPRSLTQGVEAVARRLMDASVDAARTAEPQFEALPDTVPQRLWQPTWQGVPSFYVERKCPAFKPEPRLWARNLNELQYRRKLDLGRDNLFEPVRARQSFVQLLSEGIRSKKDPYTRATPSNDLSQGICAQLRKREPSTTNF